MAEPKATDKTLVERARQGDPDAFRILVEWHAPALQKRIHRELPRLLRRKVGESDVLQAAYLTAYEKLDEFEDRGEGSFRAWLDRIVEFKLKELLRHYRGTAKRRVDREITRDQRPDTRQVPAQGPSPSAHAMARELEGKVQAGMAQLPEDYRTVLSLVREEGLGAEEVARRMNRSANAVAKLYGRAVCRLTELVLEANA